MLITTLLFIIVGGLISFTCFTAYILLLLTTGKSYTFLKVLAYPCTVVAFVVIYTYSLVYYLVTGQQPQDTKLTW